MSKYRAELCKTCIHTKLCLHDKNILGDTFVSGFFDADDVWEKYKKWEKAGFPCDDYIPAADVQEVRHGRWINDNHLIKCSICGGPIPIRKVAIGGEVMWEDNSPVNYCPNCGAKMEAECEDESR